MNKIILVILIKIILLQKIKIFNIKEYGAVGDGIHIDTRSIQKAFKSCDKEGGGIVLFPTNGTYLTGPFNLTSNTEVRVEKGAMIVGIMEKDLYPIIAPLPSYGKSRDVGYCRYQSLMFGVNLKNVRITGKGWIKGNGKYWWDQRHTLKYGRPRLIEFAWCENVEVTGVILKDSGFWTLHPVYCKNVYIHDLKIVAPSNSPNTDGVDVDSSSNVLIERVDISVGDDMISVKSGMDEAGLEYNWPTRNLTVRNCQFYTGHSISIGSEMSGGIYDVYIHDIRILGPVKSGTFIKTCRGRGGVVRNVNYENIVVEDAHAIIEIGMMYEKKPPTHNKTTTPIIKDITYSNFKGLNINHGSFECLEESPCHRILLVNVTSSSDTQWNCLYAYGKQFYVTPNTCLIPEKR